MIIFHTHQKQNYHRNKQRKWKICVVYSLNALNSYTSRLNSYIPNKYMVFCVEKFKMRRRRFELKYFPSNAKDENGNKDETNNHSMYKSYFYIY